MTDHASSRAARAQRPLDDHSHGEIRPRTRQQRAIDREAFDRDLAELEAALAGQLQGEDAPPIAANDDGDEPSASIAEEAAPGRRKARPVSRIADRPRRARRAPPRAENLNEEIPASTDTRDRLRAFDAQVPRDEEPSLAPQHPYDLDERFGPRAPRRARRRAPEPRPVDDRAPPYVRPEVKQHALVTQALRFGATVFSIMALVGVSALLVLLAIGGERPAGTLMASMMGTATPPAAENTDTPAVTGASETKNETSRIASIGQAPARGSVRAAGAPEANTTQGTAALGADAGTANALPAAEPAAAPPQLERESAPAAPRSAGSPFSPPPAFRQPADERSGEAQAAEPRAQAAAPAARPALSATRAATPAAAAPTTATKTAAVTSHVNLRATADNNGAVVAIVPAGKSVNVVECKGWCEVVYNDQKGYIHKRFLKE